VNPRQRVLLVVAIVAIVVGFANFLWFMTETAQTGTQSFERYGHFYLNNHGSPIEVSRSTYEWLTIHGASVFVTHPLALAGMAYLVFKVGFPSMVRGSSDPRRRARVDAILNSGPVVASGRCAGRVDSLRLSTPLVRVEVRPGGVVIAPFGLSAIGIESGEIVGVIRDTSSFGRYLLIAHGQTGTPAIRLWLREDDAIVAAIRSVAAASAGTLVRTLSAAGERNVERYSSEAKVVLLVMFGLAIVFAIVATQFIKIPGGYGDVGSIVLVAILLANAWPYFVRNRDRW
jgi:hypothetical protein